MLEFGFSVGLILLGDPLLQKAYWLMINVSWQTPYTSEDSNPNIYMYNENLKK